VFETANHLNARVVLQGDCKQHGSVVRGTMLRVLQEFAGYPVAELTNSDASLGKTVDRVLIAMGGESLAAINSEQFYGSLSRGRERATFFTDLTARGDPPERPEALGNRAAGRQARHTEADAES
jgi:ATP-dependent exoDNAse (exonuclease V) alpha subunit